MAKRSFLPRGRDLAAIACHYEEAEFAQAYPAIYELMVVAKREGRYRAGARLSLFADEGKLKASIWDPDTSSVWFATLESFVGALEAIERMLQEDRGEWRVRKENNGRR